MNALHATALRRPRSAVFSPRRFDSPTLGITHVPSFTIGAMDRVFCIGSCFARAVQRMLLERGVASDFGGLSHRYNTFVIEQTIRWAFESGLNESHFVRMQDGSWFDPYDRARLNEGYESAADALAINLHQLRCVREQIENADVFVMTLGLAEVWRDRETGAWLNQRPPEATAEPFNDRFEVIQSTTAQNTERIVSIVRRVRAVNPRMRFIISVSPIALNATFTQDDVLVATMLGKSTLRAAVHEAMTQLADDHTDYFPSFEIVMLQRNNDVYASHDRLGKRDGQHVRDDFLMGAIRPVFEKAYLPGAAS